MNVVYFTNGYYDFRTDFLKQRVYNLDTEVHIKIGGSLAARVFFALLKIRYSAGLRRGKPSGYNWWGRVTHSTVGRILGESYDYKHMRINYTKEIKPLLASIGLADSIEFKRGLLRLHSSIRVVDYR